MQKHWNYGYKVKFFRNNIQCNEIVWKIVDEISLADKAKAQIS